MAFRPDPRINLTTVDYVARLSQRDLALPVPINFVPVLGASITATCFPNGTYNVNTAATCISNLLLSGFRRLDLDVYWDTTRKTWSLCPVQLGDPQRPNNATSTSTTLSASTSTTRRLAQSTLAQRREAFVFSSALAVLEHERQPYVAFPQPAEVQAPELSLIGRSSHRVRADQLVTVGNFSCSISLDLSYFAKTLGSYLENTATNINASVHYLTLNVHAAAVAANISTPAQMPASDQLPVRSTFLSSVLGRDLLSIVYTPADLQQQRSNLNASGNWNSNEANQKTDSAFFNVTVTGNTVSSLNGWPGEGYIEFQNAQRLAIGFGRVDPQMSGYNITSDEAFIFPPGYIGQTQRPYQDVSSSDFRCNVDLSKVSMNSLNTSWSVASVSEDSASSAFSRAQELINCGVTPILNQSLAGRTADQDPLAYANLGLNASIWSWDVGEPKLRSSQSQSNYRCAALNTTSGHWQVQRCSESHWGSCRRSGLPYAWEITTSSTTFDRIGDFCLQDTNLAVPRTALENQYLLAEWRDWISNKRFSEVDDLIWLSFNDLDVPSCWVTGTNATCPYPAKRDNGSRTIVVPIVAAVIIFVITALMIFLKCAANRRNTRRRRRRGPDGWDYEGVPL